MGHSRACIYKYKYQFSHFADAFILSHVIQDQGAVIKCFNTELLVSTTCHVNSPSVSSSTATPETEVLALAEEHMGEISDRFRRHQVVPAKSKTEFRTFCIATPMWLHHLGPTRLRDFKVSSKPTNFRHIEKIIGVHE